ncbi:hypothetical protein SAMN05192560_1057 [Methylobacillus rhizosphaerae]|uniref:Uncharacterized protein n=1 Tax=Methylobacillus rhizosphaerae TaxID=551994 RepID=A0A238Z5D4_9PROT|nr:hypothetical protein [Methylobacillus rhizosphaerae]SNR78510.1 hypothetical protein SAMN05192560_1057 [Methylobacillus rhizosphaerae]
MDEQMTKDALTVVLNRINALRDPHIVSGPADDIPVLTEIYEGGGVFKAVAMEQLLSATPQNSAPDVRPAPMMPVARPASSIKFLPMETEAGLAQDNMSPNDGTDMQPVPRELATNMVKSIQPLIAQVVQGTLEREVESLLPQLGQEVERVIAERLREHIEQALNRH